MTRAMVMAAGAGTRLRPLTYAVPKPLVPVVNKPVLEHTLENVRKYGITEVAVNLYSHPQLIESYFGTGQKWELRIVYSKEKQLLGTAGGVKKMEEFLKERTFVVLSGDGLTDVNLDRLIHFHRRKGALATIGLKRIDVQFEFGITVSNARTGRIERFIEKPYWSDVFPNTVNTGIYVLEPEIFRYIPQGKFFDFGSQLWPALLKQRKPIYGCLLAEEEYWCDVGNLREYRQAQQDALEGRVCLSFPGEEIRPRVWVGERTVLEKGVALQSPCLLGKDCQVGANVLIGKYTTIGNNVRIEKDAVLRNCILWDNVRVARGVHLENCVIGKNGVVAEDITLVNGAVLQIKGEERRD